MVVAFYNQSIINPYSKNKIMSAFPNCHKCEGAGVCPNNDVFITYLQVF